MERLEVAWAGEDGLPHKIDVPASSKIMATRWHEKEWKVVRQVTDDAAWFMDPIAVRSAPPSFKDGFKLFTYLAWFQTDEWVRKDSWMLHLNAPDRIRAMAQFQLGSHWLAIQSGRLTRIPRHQRCCTHCPGQLEDELDLLERPMYAELRSRYGVCTWHDRMSDIYINEQFNKQNARDWNRLAEFLVQCKRMRGSYI
jgi:hypothetical protein